MARFWNGLKKDKFAIIMKRLFSIMLMAAFFLSTSTTGVSAAGSSGAGAVAPGDPYTGWGLDFVEIMDPDGNIQYVCFPSKDLNTCVWE